MIWSTKSMSESNRRPRPPYGRLFLFLPVIIFTYAISFFLPVFGPQSRDGIRFMGFEVFLDLLWDRMYGPLTIPAHIPNIMLFIGVLSLVKKLWWLAIGFGFFGLISAVLITFFTESSNIERLGLGYYVWVLSMVLLIIAGICRCR